VYLNCVISVRCFDFWSDAYCYESFYFRNKVGRFLEINGAELAQARKKIRALNPGRGEAWAPAKGTQEWLALRIGKTLRTVQNLEKGRASMPVLKAVCRELGLKNWKQYVLNYGVEYLSCTATSLIDFRAEKDPNTHEDSFFHSTTLMTIDPLSISLEEGEVSFADLRSIEARLQSKNLDIHFSWLAEVSLTPTGSGWLGWVKPVETKRIEAGSKAWVCPIMFHQTTVPPMRWIDFVEYVDSSKESQLNINVDLDFGNLKKSFVVRVSIELLQTLFSYARQKYNSDYPRRAQVKAIL